MTRSAMVSPSASQSETPQSRSTRWLLWVAGLALLLLAVRALLPPVLTWGLTRQLGQALGSRVQIDDIDLALLAGDVALLGVEISPSSGAPPGLRCDRARANLSWRALLRGELCLEVLELSGLEVRLRRGLDGVVRIPGVAEPLAAGAADAETGAEGSGLPLPVDLERLELRDLLVDYRDEGSSLALGLSAALLELAAAKLQPGPTLTWSLSDVELSGGAVSLARGEASPLKLGFALSASQVGSAADAAGHAQLELRLGGGKLRVAGPVAPTLPLSGIELAWEKLDLPGLTLLVPPELGLEVRRGASSGELSLDIAGGGARERDGGVAQGAALLARGHFEVEGLASELTAPDPVAVAWKQLQVEIEELRIPFGSEPVEAEPAAAPQPPSLRLASLVLAEPDLRVVRPKRAGPATEAEGDQSQRQPAPASPPPGATPKLALSELVVKGGRLILEDRNLVPPLETSVSNVDLAASELRWPERKLSDFRLRVGSLGREDPLTITGSADAQHAKAELQASKVSLLPVAPYVRQSSSYVITRGELSVKSSVEVDGDRFRAPTRVVLHDFLIEEEGAGGLFAEQFGVPLDVALTLLRDPVKGDITLDLPLKGTLAEGRVGLARVFADSLRRVLIHSVAAPLKLAGMLVPDAERSYSFTIPPVAFEPGRAKPKIDKKQDAAGLVKLLTEHPELALRIEAVMVRADLEALGKQELLSRGADGALSPAALQTLGELAQRRLSAVREGLEEALGGFGKRIVEVPFQGKLSRGKPRVEGRLTFAKQGS